MSNHPASVLGVCIGIGIDVQNPNWNQIITQYRIDHPAVDHGDPESLSQLYSYLRARMLPPDSPPSSHHSYQDSSGISNQAILDLFHQLGLQLKGINPSSSYSGHSSSHVKIADPPKFTGLDRKKLKPWIAHLRLKVAAESTKFPDEHSKVAYALSFLSDLAFTHYEQDIVRGFADNEPPEHFLSLERFLQHLEENFGDRGAENSALREIMELRQGNSAAYTYYTRFCHLTPYLSWEGTAFRDLFYKGLRDEIKDELARSPLPSTLEELSSRAVEIDNRLYERRQERKSQQSGPSGNASGKHYSSRPPRPSHSGPPGPRPSSAPPAFRSPGTSTTSHPIPMEVDASATRKRLTATEKQRRRAENLCLYCGKPGHYAPSCPAKTTHSSTASGTDYSRSSNRVADLSYTIQGPNHNYPQESPLLENSTAQE